jgi:DNA-binding MarR family transcriptional regulator
MADRKPLKVIPALHRATHSVSVYIERKSALPIAQAEAHILSHLWVDGESTVAQLHRAFGHKRSTLTSILDRLAERQLIEREVSESDRRTFVVRLSTAGKKFARESYKVLDELETGLAAHLTRASLEGFLATANAISSYGRSVAERPGARRRHRDGRTPTPG